MRAVLGVFCIAVASLWLRHIGRRDREGRPFGQVIIDFVIGAPRESILVIGLLLFGGILVAAHFFAH